MNQLPAGIMQHTERVQNWGYGGGGGVNVMNWLYETVASSKSLIFTLL